MKIKLNKLKRKHQGSLLPLVLIASFLFIALSYALVAIAMSNLNYARYHEKTISSLEVAEAGINYYMWHLSHSNTDYCDGQTCPAESPYGPYIHDYQTENGSVIGQYTLTITPPTPGDAIVTVKSVGRINGSSANRTVVAEVGMPSFARYAFLTATEAWFGDTETTNGPVHSNIGIHFDGTANGVVSASSTTYVPSTSFGGDDHTSHNGVWGNGGPTGYWTFPVPTIDFGHVSVDLTTLKTAASSGGISLDKTTGNKKGYYLKLKPNNTIEVYYVTNEQSSGITISALVNTYSAPINGIVYVSDNVWIDGTYSAPITIAAIATSGQYAKIKIKDNLLYSAKDGSAKIGLIAKGNIEVPQYANTNLEIDAALLSQNGHVWYPQAGGVKNSITIYGSISSFDYWTWSWVNGGGTITSGYQTTVQTYDPYLTLGPPPQFPTTGSYTILTWKEE